MVINECLQRSEEWWKLKVGKISGTRFGQVISKKYNRLIYEMMDEILSGRCEQEDFVSEDMQYGIDNELLALQLYEEQTGIETYRAGLIMSDMLPIHVASPDGGNKDFTIIQEVKCTMHGYTHIERMFEGIESKYLPQCINYFAVDEAVQGVHFISYCGFRPEKPIHVIELLRDDYKKEIETGLRRIEEIQEELTMKLDRYSF